MCTTSAQRLQRWSNIVQMLYKCFVFTGIIVTCLPEVDAGPTLKHHWDTPRVCGMLQSVMWFYCPSDILQRSLTNTINQTNVDPMLGQCRRQWHSIRPTLVWCIVFAGSKQAYTACIHVVFMAVTDYVT